MFNCTFNPTVETLAKVAPALEATNLVGKWVARGLSPSTLENIRYQVFSIIAPVSP